MIAASDADEQRDEPAYDCQAPNEGDEHHSKQHFQYRPVDEDGGDCGGEQQDGDEDPQGIPKQQQRGDAGDQCAQYSENNYRSPHS